jgi:hypothetical protein
MALKLGFSPDAQPHPCPSNQPALAEIESNSSYKSLIGSMLILVLLTDSPQIQTIVLKGKGITLFVSRTPEGKNMGRHYLCRDLNLHPPTCSSFG